MATSVPARATLALPAAGARVVVVADTHSSPHPDACARIAALAPDAILHGGDVGSLGVLDRLREIAPVYAVRGNIDARAPGLPDTWVLDLVGSPLGMLRLLLTHIAVHGPRLRAEVARLAREVDAPLVVCGHSHVPFIGRDRGITLFNPGSIGPRRFTLPIVFGLLELGDAGVSLSHVDCETGERWLP